MYSLIVALNLISNVLNCISRNWGIIMISTLLQLRKQRHTQNTWGHRQKVAGPEFVASLSHYNQTPTKVLQSLVCALRWSTERDWSHLSAYEHIRQCSRKLELNLAMSHHRYKVSCSSALSLFLQWDNQTAPSAVKGSPSMETVKHKEWKHPCWVSCSSRKWWFRVHIFLFRKTKHCQKKNQDIKLDSIA